MSKFAGEFHLQNALALSKQGAYQAAISEYQKILDSSPPLDIEMIACIGYARAIWFDRRLELRYDQAQEIHINQAKRVEELCNRAIGIYLSEFATAKSFSNLPIRENYEYASELKSKARRIQTNASRCFIATAVYGSPLEPQVVTLCRFRDEVLLSSRLGSAFVAVYYFLSPFCATLISRSRFLVLLTRYALLEPILSVLTRVFHVK